MSVANSQVHFVDNMVCVSSYTVGSVIYFVLKYEKHSPTF